MFVMEMFPLVDRVIIEDLFDQLSKYTLFFKKCRSQQRWRCWGYSSVGVGKQSLGKSYLIEEKLGGTKGIRKSNG
jgi:hypothetical protein